LIWRLYEEKTIGGRSVCPKCGHQLAWYENIPVFSFLFLLGKCRYCHKPISWQYPVVELVVALLFVASWNWELGIRNFVVAVPIPDSQFLISVIRDWLIIAVMIVIFIYDLRWYLILDRVSLPPIFILFLMNFYLGYDWMQMLLAGFVGFGFFAIQFFISRGRWIGGGDLRLGVLIGVALGRVDLLILAIMLAYFGGSIIAVFLLLNKKKGWKSEVPLGVFLAPATLIALFFGQRIIEWYFSLL
jgi:prepilin signal peptidase PulO-like enzyme (type II secretory pathway)